MPVEIVKKRRTEPLPPSNHKHLVPLRVVEILVERIPEGCRSSLDKQVQLSDIVVALPSCHGGCEAILNATRGVTIDRRVDEGLRCLRAYDVASIILTNDDEPSPV